MGSSSSYGRRAGKIRNVMVSRRVFFIGFGVASLGILLGLLIAIASNSVWAGVVVAWLIIFALALWLPGKLREGS
jgi:hypothetical protein